MTEPEPTSRLRDLVADPLSHISASDPAERRIAASALRGDVSRVPALAELLTTDRDETVRAAAAEALGTCGPSAVSILLAAAGREPDLTVIEAIAFGLGELEDPRAVDWLSSLATSDAAGVARETAVASLGAIGGSRARGLLLELSASGPPQVRRRAVVALSVYDDPEVETAIRAAAADRNPMVREAALMVLGDGPA